MERMKWGVLGTANIATQKVIPGFKRSATAEVVAIASRSLDKAAAAAASLGIARASTYDDLLADPEVESIYIPLPNHLHVPWSVKALEAGKHVLCEKPIALTAGEAAELLAARDRTGRQVLEAFMVRQHPQWIRVRELVRAGTIGDVRLVATTVGYDNRDPNNIRNMADIGGGALYDIGCYAVVFGRYIFAAEPVRASALIDRDPVMKTDRLTSGLVDFGAGRHLVFTVGTQLGRTQRTDIVGDLGRIEVAVSLNAPPEAGMTILTDLTGALDGSGVQRESFPAVDQYGLQADLATRVFRGEAPEFPIEDAVANMRVVDALYRSAESGRFEQI